MTITRLSPLGAPLALLLLAGCSSLLGPRRPPDLPEQAVCRQEARRSEEVRNVQRRWAPGANDLMIQNEMYLAEDRAFRNCLRERHLPGANGVELPQR
ncbi:hypothetical protein [Rhodovarius lipocyclicus]|uniref:hypothetical protein n=1 Tax=Rhodovarius lipocyclicus TaxID=268410 RepID=UPI00135C91B5|nr:hypothetical protein [Rhodovarius lipocyclicus]